MRRAGEFLNGHVLAVAETADDLVHRAMVRLNWSDEPVFQKDCELLLDYSSTHYVARVHDLDAVTCLWCIVGAQRKETR